MEAILERGRAVVLALWVVSVATVGAVLTQAPVPLRAPLVVTFVLLCPGAAVVRLLALRDAAASVVLSIAVSLALGMLVTEAMAILHAWSAEAGVIALAALTLALTLVPPRPEAAAQSEAASHTMKSHTMKSHTSASRTTEEPR